MAKKLLKAKKKLKESTLTPKKTLTQQSALVPKKTLAQEAEHEGESENEHENEHESEDEDGTGDDSSDGSGSDGDHDDADADVELIKKMISEYLGDGAGDLEPHESEALHSLGKQAMHAHKEMGHKEEEAYQKAGDAVALAHHLGQKQKAQQAESEDDGSDDSTPPPKKGSKPVAPAPKKKPAPSDDDGDDDDGGDTSESEHEGESEHEHESEHEGKKESKREKGLKDKLLEAEGRIAALEAKTKSTEISGYADRKLKESKQPSSITKKFREAAGTFSSKKDFDSKWKLFQEGINNGNRSVDWGLMMEKAATTEDGSAVNTKGLDFSKCID